jgi:hypothetical protein
MGKSLGIQRDGTHVAFLGGTAILIFVDLLAFLIRMNLNLLKSGDKNLLDQENFKLVLYVSFPKREEAIALDLFEGLQEIT